MPVIKTLLEKHNALLPPPYSLHYVTEERNVPLREINFEEAGDFVLLSYPDSGGRATVAELLSRNTMNLKFSSIWDISLESDEQRKNVAPGCVG